MDVVPPRLPTFRFDRRQLLPFPTLLFFGRLHPHILFLSEWRLHRPVVELTAPTVFVDCAEGVVFLGGVTLLLPLPLLAPRLRLEPLIRRVLQRIPLLKARPLRFEVVVLGGAAHLPKIALI